MEELDVKKSQGMTDSYELIGIDSEGYGKVSKCLMLDTNIDPSAKGLFAYYATYTGSGMNYAFPSKEKIMRDLKISNRTMYKYRKQLEERGYIKVQELYNKEHKQMTNHYIINMCPRDIMEEHSKGSRAAYLSFKGWGNMPTMVAMDSSLGLKAIGLYGYISALAGSDTYTLLRSEYQKLTFGLQEEPFQKTVKKLIDNGYIVRYQVHVNGSVRGAVYELTDHKLSQEEIEKEKKHRVREFTEEERLSMFGTPKFVDFGSNGHRRSTSISQNPGNSTTAKTLKNKDFYEVPEKSTTAFPKESSVIQNPEKNTTAIYTTASHTAEESTTNNNTLNINTINNNALNITPSLKRTEKSEGDKASHDACELLFDKKPMDYRTALNTLKDAVKYRSWAKKDANLDLTVEILARMLSDRNTFNVKGILISSEDVIRKLSDRLTEYHDIDKADLADFLCACAGKMAETESKDGIRINDKQKYMRSIIYDALLSNTMSVEHLEDPVIRSIYTKKLETFEKAKSF